MIDVAALLRFDAVAATWYPHAIALDRCARACSKANPAFVGEIEFELRLDLLEVQFQRRARIKYAYTPDWKYFDTKLGKDCLGWEHQSIRIEVLANPDNEIWVFNEQRNCVKGGNEPRWLDLPIMERGILPASVWKEIEGRVEERCRTEDIIRRVSA